MSMVTLQQPLQADPPLPTTPQERDPIHGIHDMMKKDMGLLRPPHPFETANYTILREDLDVSFMGEGIHLWSLDSAAIEPCEVP